MKHLRRNRSTSVSSPSSSSPPVSAPTALSSAASAARSAADRTRGSPDTPLYARFTSARRGHDGSAPALKPLVSGPLALGPKKPAQAPSLVAPPLQQQKSSESRKERERERRRDGERAEASGTPRSEKIQRELSKEESGRDEVRDGNGKAEGGENGGGPDRQQVRRMQSDGTALSAGSASAGLHGTRVEGERVLLPARKVTQKRAGGDKPAVDRGEEASAEKGTERNADRSRPARDGGGEGKDEVRAVGERVLLPARKVTRKRVPVEESESAASSPNDRPRPTLLESSRTDSGGASTSSSSRSARANELSKTRTGAVERAQARAMSPEPQASSSSPRSIAFPAANADASPSPASGVSAFASARTAAVVVVHPDGGEDQFSKPKRARMHTLATTTVTSASRSAPITSDSRPAPINSDSRMRAPRALELSKSKSTEGAARAEVEMDGAASAASAVPAHMPREPPGVGTDPDLTSPPSTSTSAVTGTATAAGAPPRRRKYSLRAAFGLPDPAPRHAPESDAGANVNAWSNIGATTRHVDIAAKPPTPTARPPPRAPSPQPAPSPSPLPDGACAPAPAPAPEPPASQLAEPKSSEAHLGVHSPAISPAPRDHRRAGPPESLLQLQSLHLSGFNFSLDALLAGDDAARDSPQAETTPAPPPPPVPPVPAAVIDVHPPSPEQLSRRLGDVPAEQPSLSDPPARHEERAVKQFASSSPSPDESKPGERQRSPVAVVFDIPARPAPIPVQPPQPSQQAPPPPRQHSRQHSQSQPRPAPKHAATVTESSQKLHKYIPRTIDLDHSLLPPESDTRYPITRRRSPTAPPASSSAPKPSASKPKRPGPAPEMPRQMSPPRPDYPPTQRGPVQGRPLIFAAMAAAEAEAELIDPKAWMAVTTLEPDTHPTPERPPLAEHSDGSSQFVNGYPTPRSTSPKSLEPHERPGKQETSAADRSVAAPAADSPHAHTREREAATRRASPPNTQSPHSAPVGLPTPTEPEPRPRARKLSKSRSRIARAPEPSQQPTPTSSQQQQQQQQKSSTLGAKPPTPVEDPPPPPRTQERGTSASRHTSQPSQPAASTHGGVVHAPAPASAVAPASAAALGSPIQLRLEKPLPERRSAESIRSPPPPRVISSESPVPRRPVKMLTERQMEKLSATKGFAPGPSGPSASSGSAPVQAARRRHEHPVPVSSPPSQSRSLPSQRPVAPEELKARTVHTADDAVQAVSRSQSSEDPASAASPQQTKSPLPQSPPHRPVSPEEYAHARTRRRGKPLEKSRPEGIESVAPAADPIDDPPVDAAAQDVEPAAEPEEPKEPTFYPLEKHVAEPALLTQLLGYMAFSDWLSVSSTSKTIRARLHDDRELSELVLERYLRTVGYARWAFVEPEPLSLTLTDLNAYMHGVSLPPHMFARHAETYLQAENRDRNRRLRALVNSLQSACRSYTRVVLRLRAQAEAEARANASAAASPTSPLRGRGLPSVKSTTSVNNVPVGKKTFSRSSSRAPSPTSSWNHSYGHGRAPSLPGQYSAAPSISGHGAGGTGVFHSPLFRLRRAPLLQVFVPSPDGEWLSDASVIECEKELKRAGVVNLLRPGDVIWDTAVGDEGNLGRLVWDGGYLIDLDYTYSRAGDLPKYLPTLAFPPSYFHRVVRTMGNGNPICHIDIAPWGEEVAANLQLLQDRMKAETPQGGHHMVVRWVHRSSFTIRPQPGGKPLRLAVPRDVGPGPGPGGAWFVDPGWLGTVVVEAEGTNEGLADLQARCRGAFPPRAQGAPLSPERAARAEAQKSVFRILREKSRPGEIWIRTVTEKERLLPP